MKYAKIENGKVTNIISATQEFVANLPGEWVECENCAIGDLWDGEHFTKPYPEISLEDAKEKKLETLKEEYQKKIDEIYKWYPKFEMDTFPVQKAEYTGWAADNTFPTPFVDTIAAQRGEDREVVLQKIGAAIQGIAGIQGELQKRRKAVEEATTIEEVESA